MTIEPPAGSPALPPVEPPSQPLALPPGQPSTPPSVEAPAQPAASLYAESPTRQLAGPSAEPPARQTGRRHLAPRTVSLITGFAATLAAGGALFALPVPYILESPGPTVDTLGSRDGKELIQIGQEPSHEVTGELRLTTVGASGTDPGSLELLQLVKGYFSANDALVPYDLIYPRHPSSQEREAQSEAEMTSSQDTATAAALEYLGLGLKIEVAETMSDAAKSAFESGDELVSVAGQAIGGYASLLALMDQVEAGSVIEVGLLRDGKPQTVSLETTQDSDGRALLGVTISFEFPVSVEFGIEDIGGPSAGSMFALGIIDKLGPVDLADGHVIAGTGTVDAAGEIGAIGGIRQKMIGAKRDGAEVFLAPAPNCGEAAGHEPRGLRVVKVSSLDDAVRALEAVRSGQMDSLPSCAD